MKKRVVVSLARQTARAYEGDRCVREWPILDRLGGNGCCRSSGSITLKQQPDPDPREARGSS